MRTREENSRVMMMLGVVGMGVAMTFPMVARGEEAGEAGAAVVGAVGQELREVEGKVTDGERPAGRPTGELPDMLPPLEMPDVTATNVDAGGRVVAVEFLGDSAWLGRAGLRSRVETALKGIKLDRDTLSAAVKDANKSLIDAGYYLALLSIPAEGGFDPESGVLRVHVDAGRVGNMQFKMRGRYFSERQLRRRLAQTRPGSPFYYPSFYDGVYDINSHPDLKMDSELKVRREIEDGVLRSYMDIDFEVEERMPLHMVLDIDNYGTETIGEWRITPTAQYLNLTRRDDVLTFSAPLSMEFGNLVSMAGSYYLPHYVGLGGASTVYGGWSELDTDEVVESIDVEGTGWFVGGQVSQKVLDSRDNLVSVSLGAVHRYIESTLVVADVPTQPSDVTLAPLSFAVSYSAKRPDALGGRNFMTSQTIAHFEGFMGAADDEEMATQRRGAEADYFIEKVQLSRIQPVLGKRVDTGWIGRSILFARVEGQVASGNLAPAEQMGIGGARSVRGYTEREFLADHGAYGNLEFRTPLMLGLLGRYVDLPTPRAQGAPADRLQLVAFADGGYSSLDDPLPGEDKSESLFSVGLGFRMAFTDHAQLRFDWAFPLRETEESDSAGRGHLNVQLQF